MGRWGVVCVPPSSGSRDHGSESRDHGGARGLARLSCILRHLLVEIGLRDPKKSWWPSQPAPGASPTGVPFSHQIRVPSGLVPVGPLFLAGG